MLWADNVVSYCNPWCPQSPQDRFLCISTCASVPFDGLSDNGNILMVEVTSGTYHARIQRRSPGVSDQGFLCGWRTSFESTFSPSRFSLSSFQVPCWISHSTWVSRRITLNGDGGTLQGRRDFRVRLVNGSPWKPQGSHCFFLSSLFYWSSSFVPCFRIPTGLCFTSGNSIMIDRFRSYFTTTGDMIEYSMLIGWTSCFIVKKLNCKHILCEDKYKLLDNIIYLSEIEQIAVTN